MAGGEFLGFNNSIYLSERDSADRNFSLAYFLRENVCFPPSSKGNIANILDLYFQVSASHFMLLLILVLLKIFINSSYVHSKWPLRVNA